MMVDVCCKDNERAVCFALERGIGSCVCEWNGKGKFVSVRASVFFYIQRIPPGSCPSITSERQTVWLGAILSYLNPTLLLRVVLGRPPRPI